MCGKRRRGLMIIVGQRRHHFLNAKRVFRIMPFQQQEKESFLETRKQYALAKRRPGANLSNLNV